MKPKLLFDEDLALKKLVHTDSPKPKYDWSSVLGTGPSIGFDIKIEDEGHRLLTSYDIAETIGEAFTNLLLTRNEKDIFSEKNQQFVRTVTQAAINRLKKDTGLQEGCIVSKHAVSLLLEKVLVQNNAFDVASSLIVSRAFRNFTKDPKPKILPMSIRLIRRNGQVVPWNQNKIEVAIRKAFLSLQLDSEPAIKIANEVTEYVSALNKAFIYIEDVQDIVQEILMRNAYYKVAEAYILYRAHRAHLREAEAKQQAAAQAEQDSMILVHQEDGGSYFWDDTELRKRIEFAAIGLDLCLSIEEIEKELKRAVHSEIKEEDLKKTIILNAKTLIEKDADFSKFAGRILLSYIYEEVLNWKVTDGVENLKALHRKKFRSALEYSVQINRLTPDILKMDIDKLADALDCSADLDFDYLGIQTLYDRYLIIDKTTKRPKRIEVPQYFWMRVAMGIFLKEEKNKEEWIKKLYNLYKTRRFCSSTPTLFNAGTKRSQLSSCYLYKVDDNIESIMHRGIADNAFLSKWAGGLGGSWTAVRGTGSYILGTNGESQGVIPFLKLHNDLLVAVNQGGKRHGAGCAYLELWHNDIYDFLELRRNTGDDRRRTHDMNTAVWIPDLFMKRMERRQHWTLFRSNEVPDLHEIYGKKFEEKYAYYEQLAEQGKIFGRKIPAIDLWKKMLTMIFETGHPWITFKDPCNIRSPQDHAGVIHSSNLCTEITLNTSQDETAVCNLGSIILDTHIDEQGALDHKKLRETIRIAVRALDNVIDINFYPTPAAERSNLRHRPIGLGVMGLHNALHIKNIPFASQAAVEFNDEFMEAIAYYAYEASSDLAAERGIYSSYRGSKWDRGILPQDTLDLLENERGLEIKVPRGSKMNWEPLRERISRQGMRNSNVLAIAPTATISNIMGTSPCIEPAYKNLFVKSNLSGEFIVLNPFLVKDLKKIDKWNQTMIDKLKYFDGELDDIEEIPVALKSKYKTAFGIDFMYIIEAAARRQKWIDQSQSVNLFLGTPELKLLSHMYRAAWHHGLKTTYYLRTLGASNIEKATVTVKKEKRGLVAQAVDSNDIDQDSDSIESSEEKPMYTEEEKRACSLDAMMNGGTCEACQ